MLSGSNEDCKIQGNNVASSCNVMKKMINYDKCFLKCFFEENGVI